MRWRTKAVTGITFKDGPRRRHLPEPTGDFQLAETASAQDFNLLRRSVHGADTMGDLPADALAEFRPRFEAEAQQ